MKHLFFGLLMLIGVSGVAQADVLNISVSESGGNVVFTGSGQMDLAGLGASTLLANNISNSTSSFFAGLSVYDQYEGFSIQTFVALSGSDFEFDTVVGDGFGVDGSFKVLAVNSGYVSETPISFIWTTNNATIAGLSLNFGVVAAFGNNTVNLLNASVAAVPEPSSWALMLLGIVGLAFATKARATKRVA